MERRDLTRRAELVRWVVNEIVQNPGVQVTTTMVEEWLHVSADVSHRIVRRLVEAGLLREVRRGVWMRTPE
jgi:Mn-dependent DtxR family transcriptional regulator